MSEVSTINYKGVEILTSSIHESQVPTVKPLLQQLSLKVLIYATDTEVSNFKF